MNQTFKFIEDAHAIHHDKLYGLSSYITTAPRTCQWFSFWCKNIAQFLGIITGVDVRSLFLDWTCEDPR